MFCPLCGKQNPEQGRFCIACARPLPPPYVAAPPYAELLPRFLARLIDTAILSPLLLGWVVLIIWFLQQVPRGPKWEHPEEALVPFFAFGAFWLVVSIVAGWLYRAILESSERQGTIGKSVMGIIITDLQGNRISFGRASVRWLCDVFLTSQTMLIGYFMVTFTDRKQTLHDMLAETIVVIKPKSAEAGRGAGVPD